MTESPQTGSLAWLEERLACWVKSADSAVLWDTTVEHCRDAASLGDLAKSRVVWLELKGRGRGAARLEASLSQFVEAVAEFEGSTRAGEYPPESDRCREGRASMTDACHALIGTVQDLEDQVPAGIWEGFLDG